MLKDVETKILEDLRQKFPVNDVAPYGECIIVPGDKFNPDWEAVLGEEGYNCIQTDIAGKPFMLVKLEREDAEGLETKEKPVEEKKGPLANLQSRVWSKDDDERLLKRMRELPGTIEQKCLQLTKDFKGRSPAAIHQKYVKLQRGLKRERKPRYRKSSGAAGPVSSVKRWSEQETQMLIELWDKGAKVPEIMTSFPGRTRDSVAMHIDVLQKEGRIKPRWKAGKGERPKTQKEPSVDTSVDTSVSTPVPTKTPIPPFKDMWELGTQLGTDLKERAEVFYVEAVKAGLPAPLIQSVVALASEVDGLRAYYNDDLAEKGEVNGVRRDLVRHKHAVTGETMLPMEASG
jgi:hypothetical protein